MRTKVDFKKIQKEISALDKESEEYNDFEKKLSELIISTESAIFKEIKVSLDEDEVSNTRALLSTIQITRDVSLAIQNLSLYVSRAFDIQ